MKKKFSTIVLVLALGGCANIEMTREEMIGTAGGALAGGVIGAGIGGGLIMNSLFATVGTLGGGVAGYMTTRALIGSDRVEYDRTTQKGLASAQDGQVLDWKNPETGNSGIFRPVRSFYTADGSYCRQYRSTVAFEKGVYSGNGMACLRANGIWQVVSDDFS